MTVEMKEMIITEVIKAYAKQSLRICQTKSPNIANCL